jgi:hypothetical protein
MAPHPGDFVHQAAPSNTTIHDPDEALRRVVAEQIGPREPGTVYDNAAGMFQVQDVVTNTSEARRILRRRSAQFAIHVLDLHTGTDHYTGAVWTGSDRVLKAVA